jgi:large subunit ribosomal protein L28
VASIRLSAVGEKIYKKQKKRTTMSKICQITGKKAGNGNNVSHSKRRTKRIFNVNLQVKKFYVPELDDYIYLKVSAAGIRTINKKGITAALKDAGYVIE